MNKFVAEARAMSGLSHDVEAVVDSLCDEIDRLEKWLVKIRDDRYGPNSGITEAQLDAKDALRGLPYGDAPAGVGGVQ
jgi:hypothetical protein